MRPLRSPGMPAATNGNPRSVGVIIDYVGERLLSVELPPSEHALGERNACNLHLSASLECERHAGRSRRLRVDARAELRRRISTHQAIRILDRFRAGQGWDLPPRGLDAIRRAQVEIQ